LHQTLNVHSITRWYEASERAHKCGEAISLLITSHSEVIRLDVVRVWFLAQMEAAIRSSESIVEVVLTRTRFWMEHSHAEVNERQLKALGRMLDNLPQEFVGGMTNKKYAHLTGTSPATAQRDLSDLVSKGYLVLRGAGRSARYELASVDRG
jgi:Fic family protein